MPDTSHVYILISESTGGYYIGYTKDLLRRVATHRSGNGGFTRGKGPWRLAYYEEYADDTAARKRELCLKKAKSKSYIKWLIMNGPGTEAKVGWDKGFIEDE